MSQQCKAKTWLTWATVFVNEVDKQTDYVTIVSLKGMGSENLFIQL